MVIIEGCRTALLSPSRKSDDPDRQLQVRALRFCALFMVTLKGPTTILEH